MGQNNFTNLKILLVEDDIEARSTIRMMLTELGISQIFEAKNGQQANDFIDIEAADIDLIISDWNMPEASGLDVLKNLKAQKPAMPFILITGRADIDSVKQAASENVDAYIRKPFSMSDLEKRIKTLFATRQIA